MYNCRIVFGIENVFTLTFVIVSEMLSGMDCLNECKYSVVYIIADQGSRGKILSESRRQYNVLCRAVTLFQSSFFVMWASSLGQWGRWTCSGEQQGSTISSGVLKGWEMVLAWPGTGKELHCIHLIFPCCSYIRCWNYKSPAVSIVCSFFRSGMGCREKCMCETQYISRWQWLKTNKVCYKLHDLNTCDIQTTK